MAAAGPLMLAVGKALRSAAGELRTAAAVGQAMATAAAKDVAAAKGMHGTSAKMKSHCGWTSA
jgi:hypothetical protein